MLICPQPASLQFTPAATLYLGQLFISCFRDSSSLNEYQLLSFWLMCTFDAAHVRSCWPLGACDSVSSYCFYFCHRCCVRFLLCCTSFVVPGEYRSGRCSRCSITSRPSVVSHRADYHSGATVWTHTECFHSFNGGFSLNIKTSVLVV